MVQRILNLEDKNVTIAIVGKYTKLEDSYLSVVESLKHAGYANNTKINIKFIDSEQISEENVKETFNGINGIIVPGGFGSRGIEGMITTIKYARENKVPFLGICLGMQMAVVEYARDVLGLNDVNSEEFAPDCKNPVIHIMEDQKIIRKKGGTMRLGEYPCILKKGSYAYKIYDKENITERHRHRYEFNNDYRERLENAGLHVVGESPDGKLVEMVEISEKDHPFFVAGQFHPEFKSRPDRPQPLFVNLVKKSIK
jgi:CTP synthase